MLLEVDGLRAGYGDIEVLHGVSLAVDADEIVALIGSNGAGKTTTMRTICGILGPTAGTIRYRDEPIGGLPTHEIVDRGIVQVPEGRNLFTGMSVLENLQLGAQTPAARQHRADTLEDVFALFPRLRERRDQLAGTMSGGEQQMLTIGRALMGDPDLLVLDEPSSGLAPTLVAEMFDAIEEIHAGGMTVLVIEQNVNRTLELADRGYVMENGRITMDGTGDELLDDERVVEAYLGV